MCVIEGWQSDELCDVLLLYKMIQLDPHFKNNYKELSRRMTDAGWHHDNNQCRQQVFFFLQKSCILFINNVYVFTTQQVL